MLAEWRNDDAAVLESANQVAQALRTAAAAVVELGDKRLALMARRLAAETSGGEEIERIAGGADSGAGELAPEGECLRRLLALEVLQDAVGIATPVIEQPTKLLQVSANTRDALSAKSRAAEKLTGLHLGHFGAFYKPSWRANDWMWGRLDASGWLSQLVLEPSRVERDAREAGGNDPAETALDHIKKIALGPAGAVHDWLQGQLDEVAMRQELAWLRPDSDRPAPTALPVCSLAVARRIHLAILSTELQGVAEAVRLDEANNALSQTGRDFQAVWNDAGDSASPEQLQSALRACNFATKGFEGEQESGLLARNASGAAATTASALAGKHSGLPSLVTKSKLTSAVRGLALAVYAMVDSTIRRSLTAFATMVLLMAAGGALLAAAVVADGTQPGFSGFGFTLVLAGWIVGLLRSGHFLRYTLLTTVVVAGCAALALAPWIIGELLSPCPENASGAVTDCTRGDIESFIKGLEPGFVVLALVAGAIGFGSSAVAPN